MTRTPPKSVTMSAGVKNALAGVKADLSKIRRVTYGETVDKLVQFYQTFQAKMEALETENKRLNNQMAEIAVNQSKALSPPTVYMQQLNAPIPFPPLPTHLCPPPNELVSSEGKYKAVMNELETVFHHGGPKLSSTREALCVDRKLAWEQAVKEVQEERVKKRGPAR